MKLPPIRYPLPTILVLVLATLLAWTEQARFRNVWNSLASGVRRVVNGPPIPASNEPMRLAGRIPRRGLLLHENTPALDRPGGSVVQTIRQRMFVNLYDVWPLSGEPTHYRVGNRQAIGWVQAADLIPWSTRLVRRPNTKEITLFQGPGTPPPHSAPVSSEPLPILEWSGGWIREAVWNPSSPWSKVASTGWEDASAVPDDNLGVLVTRIELDELMHLLPSDSPQPADLVDLRLRCALGLLLSPGTLTEQTRSELRDALPEWFSRRPPLDRDRTLNALLNLSRSWTPVASWESLEFAFLPMTMVP